MNLKIIFLFIYSFFMAATQVVGQDVEAINKKNLLQINGSLNLGYWVYNASGIEDRQNPVGWYIAGAPNITVAGINMPFTAIISDQERSFSQPFNQMGISPYYKWVKLHVGYRNMSFSEFTLGGATFLGAGIELTPGKFRFAAFYGRFRRRIENDTTVPYPVLPSYERWGYGAKVGLGGKKGFFDLIYMHSSDRPKSSDIELQTLKPEDNIVLGMNMERLIFKKLNFGLNLAASAFTSNTFSKEMRIDSIEGFEKYGFLNNMMAINFTTTIKFAGSAFLQLKLKNMSLKFSYRHVEPGYFSHGAYFLQDDLQQYLTSANFSLFKQKVMIGASGGLQFNNLDKTKAATSKRTIASLNLMFLPGAGISIGLTYANFGTTMLSSALQMNDSIYMSIINQNIGLNISYSWSKTNFVHQLGFNSMFTKVDDRNEFTRAFTRNDILFNSVSYNLGINKIQLNAGIGLSYTILNSYNSEVTVPGLQANVRKMFFKKTMSLSLTYNIQKRTVNQADDGDIQTITTDIKYTLKKKNTFSVGFTQTLNNSSAITSRTFNENRIRLQYGYIF